jgi:hypothetical protein
MAHRLPIFGKAATVTFFRLSHPSIMQTATQILDDKFLEVRARLLEVAATLDRIDRSADESAPLEDRAQGARKRVDDAIRILLSEGPDRAERLQRLFSRDYEENWRQQMQL